MPGRHAGRAAWGRGAGSPQWVGAGGLAAGCSPEEPGGFPPLGVSILACVLCHLAVDGNIRVLYKAVTKESDRRPRGRLCPVPSSRPGLAPALLPLALPLGSLRVPRSPSEPSGDSTAGVCSTWEQAGRGGGSGGSPPLSLPSSLILPTFLSFFLFAFWFNCSITVSCRYYFISVSGMWHGGRTTAYFAEPSPRCPQPPAAPAHADGAIPVCAPPPLAILCARAAAPSPPALLAFAVSHVGFVWLGDVWLGDVVW